MRDIYRNLDLPVDDTTLMSLEGLTKQDIIDALRIVCTDRGVDRTINRLHNAQKRKAATRIKAFQLTGQGFEPMAEIEFVVDNLDGVTGKITNAVDIGNEDSIAVTVYDKNRETAWLLGRDSEVNIWRKEPRGRLAGVESIDPPDYDKVVEHGYLKASYIAEHLTTFLGKRISIKNQGTGELAHLGTRADNPEMLYFALRTPSGIGVITCGVHEDSLVDVQRVPRGTPPNVASASAILANPAHYLGRRVVFDNDRVDGVLQDVIRRVGTQGVILKVNGEEFQLYIHEMVKVYPREEPSRMRPGRYPWASDPRLIPPVNPGRNPFLSNGRRGGKSMMQEAMRRFNEGMSMVPDDRPDYTDAYSLAVQDKIQYRGMTAELKPGLKGTLTQVQLDNEGKVLFVIDGIIYKRNRGHIVRLWKKEN